MCSDEQMGKGRVLGGVPDDREVKTGAEAAAERNRAGESHGPARWYRPGAKSASRARAAAADGL
jgi:hypothetical protein